MLFYIPSCAALAQNIDMPKGSCTFEQFADGEWHVKVHDEVRNKIVWVLAQTGQPADTIIQLLVLCDALQRAGAQLNLMISYFGYARQDKVEQGQALAAELMCRLIQLFSPERVEVIQLHNPGICKGLLRNHIPYQFFYDCVQDADIIVAPDKGAQEFAQHIADYTNTSLALVEKHRIDPQTVTMRFTGDVTNKNILIVDDMISTGGTIAQAAHLLHEHGANTIRVAATHGVFAGDALKKLQDSTIKKVYVTNTLHQKQEPAFITGIDIGPFITKILYS